MAVVAFLLASCGTPPNTLASFGTSPSSSASVAAAPSSPSPTPPPTASPALLPASAAWGRVRAALPPTVAVPTPTWLPDGLDATVEVANVTASPPSYSLWYLRGGDRTLRFAAGVSTDTLGSSIGTRVRGVGASITFPTSIFTSPAPRVLRRLAWREGGTGYVIESEVLTGDTLLHVGWSLDRTGVAHPIARTKIGSCASVASPQETVRNWVLALGHHSEDTIIDCFADDAYTDGSGFAAMEADALPTATVERVGPTSPIGGRTWVAVSWSFTSDPGDRYPQGQHASLNYIVGLDGDRYRIFEGGTGAYAPPP
ncbi:MAG TPA: hypothetical protein VI814_06450 [Candidatus Limnocylindria bacterium]